MVVPLDDVGLNSLQGLDNAGLQLWYEFFFPITTLASCFFFEAKIVTTFVKNTELFEE